jgi:hypothetical protein
VNKVLLTGRLTRDPEMRGLASGTNVTTFRELPDPRLRGRTRDAGFGRAAEPPRSATPLSADPSLSIVRHIVAAGRRMRA